jgi:two-component system, chemotaxis family, sensor kinase CheA
MNTFLDDETLNLYIAESKEHLETIESDLLELEKQGEDFDEELVNKVFRAAHSIKGGGGFLGLNQIKDLAHKIESVLHLVRTNQMTPTPGLINILLAAYDRLGELIDSTDQSNEMDISDHVEKLEAALQGEQEESAGESKERELVVKDPRGQTEFRVRDLELKQAQEGGKLLYILNFDAVDTLQGQNKSPEDVIGLLHDSGVIVGVQSDSSPAGDQANLASNPTFPMSVLFASIVEPDLVGIMFNLVENQISVITRENIKPAGSDDVKSPGKPAAETKQQKAVATKAEAKPEIKQPSPAVPAPAEKEKPVKSTSGPSETLRVNVGVLDQLMNKAGELVLARNQLIQAVNSSDHQNITTAVQPIDQVTSELQETIMLTRMQPVGIVFNKFPRLVRGLAMDLGKKMDLQLEGADVELDKTMIEGLGDPLTHLVRNSADHGIELPDDREKKGKPRIGKIQLKAFYESGQVLIEIIDDGKGLDAEKIAEKAVSKGLHSEEEIASMSEKEKLNLIMLPGFSTAEKVTDVSGRGVGMDVVKTNLDKMGGLVELISKVDQGTTIRIKLPLTLAIIPSLLVQSTNQKFAIPQANVRELLRIPAAEIRNRVEKIGEADVLILRGELIPLLQLNNVLKLKSTFYDFKAGTFREDRRSGVMDQRLVEGSTESPEQVELPEKPDLSDTGESTAERRQRRESDAIVVVLNEGPRKYGLIVDAVFDSVEIVVKPLGKHLKSNRAYAGATIMGDGHLALILDVNGMAELAELKPLADLGYSRKEEDETKELPDGATRQTLLIFHNGPDEPCAVPLEQVLRVERIIADEIEIRGGKKIIQYRGGSLTVYALEEVANVEMLEAREKLIVIIFKVAGNEVGLLALQPLDVVDQDLVLDDRTLRQPGVAGSTIINGETTLLVDVYELVKIINPHWFQESTIPAASSSEPSSPASESGEDVLLVEDSQFFRNQVKRFIEEAGYAVIEAEDGQQAWDYINEHPKQISIVVTDLEMPNMDGFELTRHLKNDSRFAGLPVIALTSLASDDDIRRGKEVGIDEYQIKLDKEKLMESIRNRFK